MSRSMSLLNHHTHTHKEGDLATCNPDGTVEYHFDELFKRLDPLVEASLDFVFVMDNVPWCLSHNASVGPFNENGLLARLPKPFPASQGSSFFFSLTCACCSRVASMAASLAPETRQSTASF